ncbi:MAG: hypothetical protein GX994_05225 [Firmicutes bacterium]|nr:hypothetical protein [Bacillota bacterium]
MKIHGIILFYCSIVLIAIFVIILFADNRRYRGLFNELSFLEQEKQQSQITLKENEMHLLAKAVYAEAKGEPYEGQVAVAAVILNRVDHPEFPNTIAGVLYEPLAFQVVANGQINQEPDSLARQAAYEALHGLDPTNGALYFYNPSQAKSQWIRSRPVIKAIGKHVFTS